MAFCAPTHSTTRRTPGFTAIRETRRARVLRQRLSIAFAWALSMREKPFEDLFRAALTQFLSRPRPRSVRNTTEWISARRGHIHCMGTSAVAALPLNLPQVAGRYSVDGVQSETTNSGSVVPFLFALMAHQEWRLRQREQEDQGDDAPDLEIHPDVGGEIAPHDLVERTPARERKRPSARSASASLSRSAQSPSENIFDEQAVEDRARPATSTPKSE